LNCFCMSSLNSTLNLLNILIILLTSVKRICPLHCLPNPPLCDCESLLRSHISLPSFSYHVSILSFAYMLLIS
jgi:hypothetical protein